MRRAFSDPELARLRAIGGVIDFSGTPGAAGDPNHYHGSESYSVAPHDAYAGHDDGASDLSHYPVGPDGAGSSAAHAALPSEDLDAGGHQDPPVTGQYFMGPDGAGSSAAHAAFQPEHLGDSACSDPSDEGPLGTDGGDPHQPPALLLSRPVSAAQALDELPPPSLNGSG